MSREVWPGRPFPLGPTWDGHGTNFSLFSEHAEGVELPGESDLLLGGQAVAGGLLAVAERGVENQDVGGAHGRFRFREG